MSALSGGGASADVVIVGAGVTGLSTARALVELGVREVLVLDRAAIGSGGTGKSSGIVRCHYGIRSLAAMAWHALPVLADAQEILGAESGYRRTGYLVGVGAQNIGSLRANVAMHRSIGIDVDLVGHDTAQELWPAADLSDFAAFAFEPQGGYGDGHQTALAFSVAARRGGARVRQHSAVSSLELRHDRVTGVRLENGDHIAAGQIVLAAGAWSVALAAGVGLELPIRSQRAQVLLVDPGQPINDLPVFSDLAALQYVRMDGASAILVGDSDHADPEWSDPDHYRERAGDEELNQMIPKFERRFPGLSRARLSSSYAGCYDVTPDYNPVISASPLEGLWICAGFSGHGYKISPSVGELMADLLTAGSSRHPDVDHHDFRWDRFASDELLVSPHPYAGAGQMR
jgi:glycine/D-amino acid oxidase-like deaminating enzyme